MNAFAGFISLDHEAVHPEQLESMAMKLVGYVPDQKYLFGSHQARFVQLIRHNTPESFHEPSYQNYLHDIRLDNHEELAGRLGLNLKTPDSFLVLKAYERWGENCLSYLRGDFTFAIWDPKSQELFCARDPLGQRLLFYVHLPGRFFAFSSVVSGLLNLVPREINPQKIKSFLALSSHTPEETFYQKIFRLQAGEYLKLKQGRITRKFYWSLEQPKPVRFKKDSDYLEAFLEIFGHAVRCRLKSAFPMGAHLSGGLDSSSVVALAAQELARLTTFSAFPPIGYKGPTRPNWNLDDTHYVQMLTQRYPQLDPVHIRSEPGNLFEGLDAIYAYTDVPILNPCNRVWIHDIFEKASQRNIRVLLTGSMGNATISWKGMTLKQQLGHIARFPRRLFFPTQWDIRNPRQWMISTGIISEALSFYHSQRAYFGIEFRDPTHDQRLVEFCLGLPNSQFARQGQNRMLIRRAMQGLLPDALRMRRDQGSQLAHWPWVIEHSYPQICQEWCVLRTSPIIQELVNIQALDNFVATWPKAQLDHPEALGQYRFTWLRAFFVARFVNWIHAA